MAFNIFCEYFVLFESPSRIQRQPHAGVRRHEHGRDCAGRAGGRGGV